ncbi:MAG: D-Ala-D-Ala carboxypeptidase family metallohydrolase [Parvularcula sp.]|jgi:hypothetical protein|nr:D-Ala-D-Ala carboxypeptidase family metallohydrolase [Parvularcula sp.]
MMMHVLGMFGLALTGLQPQDMSAAGPLRVQIDDLEVDYPVFFAAVLPEEVIEIEVQGRPDERSIRFAAPDAGQSIEGPVSLSWQAPTEPGHHQIMVSDSLSGDEMLINIFVMVPATKVQDGVLNGYRIGEYPATPLRGLNVYKPPLGFIAVNDETRDVQLSPHFTLGQFICKQDTTAPERYVVLQPQLLKKLEDAVDLLEADGFDPDTLFVMSGYRTPFYNKAIGNVPYSRHVYGDAADVYLDVAPRDGDMDDLNRDGQIDKADAHYLYDMIAAFGGEDTTVRIQGGIGSYDRNAVHGPFVHIDTRGTPARWGR